MLARWSLPLLGLLAVAGAAAACEGLSPGDELNVGSSICTLGFIVANADGLYFSTAGHCIHDGDTASTPDIGDWGVGVFHFLEPETGAQTDGSPGFDFALVEIDPSFYDQLNPKMCGYDGPVGLYDETPGSGGVGTYGHGLVWGDAARFGAPTNARPGFGLTSDGESFYWYGANTPGDSGGAVIADDGRAIGVLTHLSLGLGGTNGGTHLERGFRLAEEEGFTGLRLVLMGEDPVAVLRELQAAAGVASAEPEAPAPATPTAPGSSNATRPGNSTAPPASAPGPSAQPPPRDDSIVPADDAGAEEQGETNRTPLTPAPLLAVAVAALALALRKR